MKTLASILLLLICLFKGNFSLLLLLLLLRLLLLLHWLTHSFFCSLYCDTQCFFFFFLPEAPTSPKHLLIETSSGDDGGYIMVDGHAGNTEDGGGADYSGGSCGNACGGSCGNACSTSPPRRCYDWDLKCLEA